MEVHSEEYTLHEKLDTSFDVVPRGLFVAKSDTKIALDYHKDLLRVETGDAVCIKLYAAMPVIDKKIYLMQGVVYDIHKDGMDCSFGGLILMYRGPLNHAITNGMDIFVSVEKIL